MRHDQTLQVFDARVCNNWKSAQVDLYDVIDCLCARCLHFDTQSRHVVSPVATIQELPGLVVDHFVVYILFDAIFKVKPTTPLLASYQQILGFSDLLQLWVRVDGTRHLTTLWTGKLMP